MRCVSWKWVAQRGQAVMDNASGRTCAVICAEQEDSMEVTEDASPNVRSAHERQM